MHIDLKNLLEQGVEKQRFAVLNSLDEKRDDPQALNLLFHALTNENNRIRARAFNVLNEIDQDITDQVFVHILKSPDENNTRYLFRCLDKFRDKSEQILISSLESDKDYVVLNALESLSTFSTQENLVIFIKFLHHSAWKVRKQAYDSIINICYNSNAEFKSHAIILLNQCFKKSIHSNSDARYLSAKLIGAIGKKASLKFIEKLLNSKKPEIRFCSIGALNAIRTPEAAKHLMEAFKDSSWLNRKHASDCLAKFGNSVIKDLNSLFKSGDSDLKYWAIRTMVLILKEKSCSLFSGILSSNDVELKYYVLSILSKTPGNEKVGILKNCLKDDSWVVKKVVSELLATMGPKITDQLQEILSNEDDSSFWAAQACAKMGGKGLEVLLEFITNPSNFRIMNFSKRISFIEILFEHPGPGTDRFMAELLIKDSSRLADKGLAYFREKEVANIIPVVELLGSSKSISSDSLVFLKKALATKKEQACKLLSKKIEDFKNDNFLNKSDFIKSVLESILSEEFLDYTYTPEISDYKIKSVEEYVLDLDDNNADIRYEALCALSTIDDPGLRGEMKRALNDNSDLVRAKAEEVLKYEIAEFFTQDADNDIEQPVQPFFLFDEHQELSQTEHPSEKVVSLENSVIKKSGIKSWKKWIALLVLIIVLMISEYYLIMQFNNIKPKNLALNIKHAIALKRLGEVFFEKKEYLKSEKFFNQAIEKVESYPDSWYRLSQISYKNRNFKKALKCAENAEKYYDNNWDNYTNIRHEALYLLGNLYTINKDFKQAQKMYKKTLKIKPGYKAAEIGLKQIDKYIKFYVKKKSK